MLTKKVQKKQRLKSTINIFTRQIIIFRDNAVRIATGYEPLHVVQTGSRAHLASYPIGTGGSFSGGKAAGA
jgi:hypothetical protein